MSSFLPDNPARFVQHDLLDDPIATVGHVQVALLVEIDSVGADGDVLADGLERGDQMGIAAARLDLHAALVEAEPIDGTRHGSVAGLARRRIGDVHEAVADRHAVGDIQPVGHHVDLARLAVGDADAQQPRVVGRVVHDLAVGHVQVPRRRLANAHGKHAAGLRMQRQLAEQRDPVVGRDLHQHAGRRRVGEVRHRQDDRPVGQHGHGVGSVAVVGQDDRTRDSGRFRRRRVRRVRCRQPKNSKRHSQSES